MRIVGIAAQDWANAAFNAFAALKRYDIDAHLITLFQHTGGFVGKYDIKGWLKTKEIPELLNSADVYVLFESGGTMKHLRRLKLKDRPRVVVVNSSAYYHGLAKFSDLRPKGKVLIGLTANYPAKDIVLCSQPVDERLFKVRKDYKQIGKKILCAGAAPFMKTHKAKKGLLKIEKNMPLHYIMGEKHSVVLKRMLKECDIFTHGIYYAYGYTLVEAAMMAIPCFGSILERDKRYLLLDGEYPVYDIGREGQHIPEMLKFFSSEKNRRAAGQKMRSWALKHHSQKAFSEKFINILKEAM